MLGACRWPTPTRLPTLTLCAFTVLLQAFLQHQAPNTSPRTSSPAPAAAQDAQRTCWEHASPSCQDFYAWWHPRLRSLDPRQVGPCPCASLLGLRVCASRPAPSLLLPLLYLTLNLSLDKSVSPRPHVPITSPLPFSRPPRWHFPWAPARRLAGLDPRSGASR